MDLPSFILGLGFGLAVIAMGPWLFGLGQRLYHFSKRGLSRLWE